MARTFYRTKTHLRDELRARLGFGSQTATTIQNKLMGSWLDSARSLIYNDYTPDDLRVTNDHIQTTVGYTAIGWPQYANRNKLVMNGVYAKVNGQWRPLTQGIDYNKDTDVEQALYGAPEAWDYGSGGVLEIWPRPDDNYDIRLETYFPLNDFRADLTEWQASTVMAVGDIVIPTSPASWPTPLRGKDKFYYEVHAVTGDATTGSTEPTWSTTLLTDAGLETIYDVDDNNVSYTVRPNDCMVDDTLVLELAIAYGKAHYRQADAEFAMSSAMRRLDKLKAQQHGRRRYLRKPPRRMNDPFPSVSDDFVRS